jgi:hypothetical protein
MKPIKCCPVVLIYRLQTTKGFSLITVKIYNIYVITCVLKNLFRLENIALPTMCLADFTGAFLSLQRKVGALLRVKASSVLLCWYILLVWSTYLYLFLNFFYLPIAMT